MRPLFRWTVGPCIQQGFDILTESVKKTTQVLGDSFDYMICYNGIKDVSILEQVVLGTSVRLYEQTWDHVPIDESMRYVNSETGTEFNHDGNIVGGSFWKVVPPRMRMETHEIVMDNDMILLDYLPQIKDFLNSNKVLILEEPIRFYGRFSRIIPNNDCLNSGLMGYPPGYDFGESIKQVWEENWKHTNLTQADEQGLLMATLSKEPNIRIKKTDIVEFLARDFMQSVTGLEKGLHFVQSNKLPNHRAWVQYNKLKASFGNS